MKNKYLIIALLLLGTGIAFSQTKPFEGKVTSTIQVGRGSKTESVEFYKNGNQVCDIAYMKTKMLYKDGISYTIDYSGLRPVVTVISMSEESRKSLNKSSKITVGLEKEEISGHSCIKVTKQSESSVGFFTAKKHSQTWIDTSLAFASSLSPTGKGLLIKSISTMDLNGRKTTTVTEVVSIEECPVPDSLFYLPDTTEARYIYSDDVIAFVKNPSDTALAKKIADPAPAQKSELAHCAEITDATFAKSIKRGVCVVDFSAVWCKPCKMLQPVLDSMAAKNANRARFFTMDIDKSKNTAKELEIKSVPMVIVFRNGEEVGRIDGFYPDMEKQIEKLLEEAE